MPNSRLGPGDLTALRSLDGHAGMSGASLLRGTLTDGRPVVVKHSTPRTDLFQSLLGHPVGLEYVLWESGVLSGLPAGIATAVIGGWLDDDGGSTIVMDDLGASILGWGYTFTAADARWFVERVNDLHAAQLRPSVSVTPLENVVNTFAPSRIRTVDPAAVLLTDVERGWAAFRTLCPAAIADAVTELVEHPGPLARALESRPSTFCHGDVAAVNMARQGDGLVLIDWGQAFIGPPVLDIVRFLPSGLRDSAVDRDWLLAEYAGVAGRRFDPVALRLALLATLVWFGWSKALDALEHPDPRRRADEVDGLAWWCARVADITDLT
ncbi:phosphotransferase [Streptomyces sp. NPDC056402]|uniref:phosphotransferase n=1 Tax=Streptomyces sp. NPDC056402 TaxID=3345810 RepID=UPI0035E26B94